MAFRITTQLRSVSNRLGGSRPFATSVAGDTKRPYNKFSMTGEFAPVAVLGGMLFVVVAMACHTGKQQLKHSPTVSTKKKRRGIVAEVDDPDHVVTSADKFINYSWLRRVSQIQDKSKAVIPDTTRPNPYTRPRTAETLKSVGVDPRGM